MDIDGEATVVTAGGVVVGVVVVVVVGVGEVVVVAVVVIVGVVGDGAPLRHGHRR